MAMPRRNSQAKTADNSPGTVEDPEGVRNPLLELSDGQATNIEDKCGDGGSIVGKGVPFNEFLGGTMTVKPS